ncbi:Uma2 family endonuclease [Streptomyces sp. NPDC052051]|uniref:Uma2 family endonuclease n=1 Tax=Streptomyces sp. NPDC052051 TaxID=3154649 RepID=UPI003440A722
MTVLDDRFEMADADANTERLDEWFERLEHMPVPEGFRVEIVGGNVFMTPQRKTRWQIIRRILWALEDRFGREVMAFTDVRIDFPGDENGFCPDVAMLKDSAREDDKGHWQYQDVKFIAEVISKSTAANDYGPKKTAYATAEVPVYLIADPYQGRCHLFTQPKNGDYLTELLVAFGADVGMTTTPLGLVLKTDGFPRD